MTKIIMTQTISCECGFATRDLHLMANHSCDIQAQGGRCEDFPCCGHEAGDCNGQLYGSDEAIKAQVETDWATGHGYCDHADGIYNCEDMGEEPDEDDDTYDEVAFAGSDY